MVGVAGGGSEEVVGLRVFGLACSGGLADGYVRLHCAKEEEETEIPL